MQTEALTLSLTPAEARTAEWTEDTVAILQAAMARTGLVEDDVAAAWKVAADYYGAEGADAELTDASRERILTLAESYG